MTEVKSGLRRVERKLMMAITIVILLMTFESLTTVYGEGMFPAKKIAGNYGQDALEFIDGNVEVVGPVVKMRNVVISGDLYIAEGISIDSLLLEGVSVKGDTRLRSNGDFEAVIKDSWLNSITIAGIQRIARISVAGATQVSSVKINSEVEITESNITSSGISEIRISAGKRVKLTDVATKKLIIDSSATLLNMMGRTSAERVEVNRGGSTLYLDTWSKVGFLNAQNSIRVLGIGAVENADIGSAGISFRNPPVTMTIKTGLQPPEVKGTYVESFTPKDGTSNIATNTGLSLRFNGTVRLTTGSPLDNDNVDWSVSIREGSTSGVEVPYNASTSSSGGKTSIFVRPLEALKAGEVYYISLKGLEDELGNPILGKTSYAFMTKTIEAPVISSVYPGPDAKEIPIDAEFSVRFSDEMRGPDKQPINEKNVKKYITLKRQSSQGQEEPFDVQVTNMLGQTEVRILSTYYLDVDSQYYLSFHDLYNSRGQALQGEKHEISFHTIKQKPNVPIIKSLGPRLSSGRFVKDRALRIEFNERLKLADGTMLGLRNSESAVLLKEAGNPLNTIVYDAWTEERNESTTLYVKPVSVLKPETKYQLEVQPMMASDGRELEGVRSFLFEVE